MKEKKEGDRGFDIKVLGSSSWEVGAAEAGHHAAHGGEGGGGGRRGGVKRQPAPPQPPSNPSGQTDTHTSSLVC